MRLAAFRNHVESQVDFGPGLNVIYGPNGAGKTSVLEAIHLLCSGRSFRTSSGDALLRVGEDAGVVVGEARVRGRDVSVAVGLGQYPTRFALNGIPQRRWRDVAGHMRGVVFSPDDLELTKGSPGVRRAFLDSLMAAISPRMAAAVAEWERVLAQRNSLLKATRGRSAPASLPTWTELLIEKGAELGGERMKLCALLRPVFEKAAAAFGHGPVRLDYVASWIPSGTTFEEMPDAVMLERWLRAAAEDVGSRERQRGVTLAGPHRDDLQLTVDARDARTRASQGEQRSLALALRLAQLRVLENVLGDEPILLLDDVFSELDPKRRRTLLEHLPRAQVLVTVASDPGSSGPPREVLGVLEDFVGGNEEEDSRSAKTNAIRVEQGKVLP